MFYKVRVRMDLCVYGVKQKSLGMYTTHDSDLAKGISRIPLALARIDIIDDLNPQAPKQQDLDFWIDDNFNDISF
jgi:hypothetical protein